MDFVIYKAKDSGKINSTVANLLINGKEAILSSVEKNIASTLEKQTQSANSIEDYIKNWKENYNKKDFEAMEVDFEKMEKELKKLIPIENTLKEARYVENVHNLIKNNGQNFELTDEELILSSKLV